MKIPRKVYVIHNTATQRVYVGSSYDPEQRFKNHLSRLRNNTHPVEDMQRDYNEHGESFTFSVIDEINSYTERNKEYKWQLKLNSRIRGKGYNYKDPRGDSQADACLSEKRKLASEINELIEKTADIDLLKFIRDVLQKS